MNPNIHDLQRDSKSKIVTERTRVAQQLSKFHEEASINILISMLNDMEEAVRDEAAISLAKIGDSRAIIPLVECYIDSNRKPKPDEDGDVSWVIPHSLKQFGETASLALLPYIEHRGVIWLIGYIGSEVAIDSLIEAFRLGSPHITYPVMNALDNIQSPKSIPFLKSISTDPEFGNRSSRILARIQETLD